MSTELSIGKWRGLKTTSGLNNTFSILAFDQRGSYRRMLPDDATYEDAVRIKHEVVTAIAPYATAVLLDPVYGLKSMQDMAGSSGLLMAVEKTGYSGEATARQIDFIDGWTVAKIKQVGASAVKLLAYYNPDAGAVAEQIEETVRQVAATCRQHDIALFVEPVSYSIDPNVPKSSPAFAAERPRIVRETIERLGQPGVDVLKVEFPVDAAFDTDQSKWREACDAITAVSHVPWALLSAGVDYETFVDQVDVACAAGASGFLCGRAVWKECITMTDDDRQTFLRETAIPRMKRLREIVELHARPWTDYYEASPAVEGWYKAYPEG